MKPRKNRLKPIIKWAGGKEKELPQILMNLPLNKSKYIEPFVGGGAVALSIEADEMHINDKSLELITLYKMLKEGNNLFFTTITEVNENWKQIELNVSDAAEDLVDIYLDFKLDKISERQRDKIFQSYFSNSKTKIETLITIALSRDLDNFNREIIRNLKSKTTRMKKLEIKKGDLPGDDLRENIECAFKSAYYMHLRYLYNNALNYGLEEPVRAAIFYFIREYCYSSMFRYNKNGHFNVPYGGISYNRKYLDRKIDYMQSIPLNNHLKNTEIFCMDFQDFLRCVNPCADDFIFFDPPYDSDFSTYTKNSFGKEDQIRLSNCIKELKCCFMLVIKNTELISSLYPCDKFNIKKFDKKYLVSFQNRNHKDAEHLMITNY